MPLPKVQDRRSVKRAYLPNAMDQHPRSQTQRWSRLKITPLARCTLKFMALVIINVLVLFQSTSATTLQPLSLGQLTRISSLVVRGVVTHKEVIDDERGAIWSVYQIRLLDIWRGSHHQVGDTLQLALRGGTLGQGVTLRGQMIPAQPQLNQGQEGVFFLERASTGQLVFTGMSQGWFSVIKRDGVHWVSRDPSYRTHLHKTQPVQRFVGAPQNPDLMPLSQLRALVKRGATSPRAIPSTHPLTTTPSLLNVERRGR